MAKVYGVTIVRSYQGVLNNLATWEAKPDSLYNKVNNVAAYKQQKANYERSYPGIEEQVRPVDGTKKASADADKHYIEIKSGGIRVRLDVAELTVEVNHKSKFTMDEVDKLKKDLASSLDIVASAAKMNEKLKPAQGAVEI